MGGSREKEKEKEIESPVSGRAARREGRSCVPCQLLSTDLEKVAGGPVGGAEGAPSPFGCRTGGPRPTPSAGDVAASPQSQWRVPGPVMWLLGPGQGLRVHSPGIIRVTTVDFPEGPGLADRCSESRHRVAGAWPARRHRCP